MFSKVEVNGDGAEPFYKWMKESKKVGRCLLTPCTVAFCE